MNWDRVYNILIVTFLIINTVLYVANQKNENKYELTQVKKAELLQVMASNYISVYDYFPSYSPMQRLIVKPYTIDEKKLVNKMFGKNKIVPMKLVSESLRKYEVNNETLLINTSGINKGLIKYENISGKYPPQKYTQEEVLKSAKRFAREITLNNVKLQNSSVYFDAENNIYTIEYNEYYKEYPIFSSYVKLIVSEKGVIKAESKRLIPDKYISDKHYIVPIDVVLYSLIDEIKGIENKPMRITRIQLGYDTKVNFYEETKKDYVEPYYVISLGDRKEYYVNAYTNEILK